MTQHVIIMLWIYGIGVLFALSTILFLFRINGSAKRAEVFIVFILILFSWIGMIAAIGMTLDDHVMNQKLKAFFEEEIWKKD